MTIAVAGRPIHARFEPGRVQVGKDKKKAIKKEGGRERKRERGKRRERKEERERERKG